MRTLSEIIEAAKGNEAATVDELRYALCAVCCLAALDRNDLKDLSRHNESRLIRSDVRLAHCQSFRRWMVALEMNPKYWLGPEMDPESERYQFRREIAAALSEDVKNGNLPLTVVW